MTHRRSRASAVALLTVILSLPRGRKLGRSLGLVLTACLAATVFAGCTEEEKKALMEQSAVPVERVIDGDTVVLKGLGTTRLIGVNTPEEGRCGDNAATRFTRSRLEGKRVKVELDEDPKDRYGRTLAYLTRGNTMHNLALVEEGYASVLTIPPNDKYADRFEAGEDEAKRQEEGPQETCARKKRQALVRERALARERAEARRRLAGDERRLRAVQRRERATAKRAKQLRDGGDSGGGDSGGSGSGGSGSGGSGSGGIPKNCSGVSGSIPTPPSDPTNLDGDNDGEACE